MSAQSTLSVESLDDGGGSDTFDENHQPDFRAKRGAFAKIKNKVSQLETMVKQCHNKPGPRLTCQPATRLMGLCSNTNWIQAGGAG